MIAAIYNSLPTFRIDSPQNMLKKAQQVALPTIALLAASAPQGASAIGCLTCVLCLAGGGGPFCIPACILCGVTIPVPLGLVSLDTCDLNDAPC